MKDKKSVDAFEKKIIELKAELLKENRELKHRLEYLSQHLEKIWEGLATANGRIQDLEIYNNIVTRLLTTVCIDKLGISQVAFRKMLKVIQDQTIADSQVNYLEELYRMDEKSDDDDNPSDEKPKKDPS